MKFKKKIFSVFDKKIKFFSFPFGKDFHRNSHSEKIASQLYKYNFSSSGEINKRIDVGPIKRIGIHNENIDNLINLLLKRQ